MGLDQSKKRIKEIGKIEGEGRKITGLAPSKDSSMYKIIQEMKEKSWC